MTRALHQSGAKVAANCLARYKAEIIDGAGTDGPYSQLGTAVHAAIEAAFRGTVTGNREPLDCALEGLDVWIDEHEESVSPWVEIEAMEMLRKAYHPDSRLWLRLPHGQTTTVEQTWFLDEEFRPVTDESAAAYAGRFDILQYGSDGLRLRDVKTIMAMPGKAFIPADIQARVYAMAALAIIPQATEVTFSLILIRHDYETRHVFVRGEPWERQIKRWLRDVRAAVVRAEESDVWPATPGEGCKWCPVRHECEALTSLIETGTVSADDCAVGAARIFLAMNALVGDAGRAAKAYAEDGDIPVGIGKALGFVAGVKDKLKPLAHCLAQLRADGVDDEMIARNFPGASITKEGLKGVASELLARGEIEGAPHEWAALFTEEVPSATFKVHLKEGDDG